VDVDGTRLLDDVAVDLRPPVVEEMNLAKP